MIELFVAFLSGCLLTLVLVAAGVLGWLYSQSRPVKASADEEGDKPFIIPQLPESLQYFLGGDEGRMDQNEAETCRWFNFISAFLFQELRDSMIVKKIMMKKIKKEFEDLMLTKTEGRMIEQLMVRDYFMGTSLPVIHSAKVVRVEGGTEDSPEIQELDIILVGEYTGKFQLAIDADLVFDKAAYVSVELSRLKGKGRLRYSRKMGSSWSLAFIEDPIMELKVNSHFEGRRYPQLSSIIESQIRKWLKRKHTLPAYKIRYKPFFRKIKPQSQLLDVYVHDQKLTVGKLYVYVMECSRLPEVDGACSVYCTVSIGSKPWQPAVHLWKTQWPVLEFLVRGSAMDETIGIQYRLVIPDSHARDEGDQSDIVVVSKVLSPSPALTAGVKEGDVLTRVNNVKVTSVRQARRLMKKFKETNSILITVKRPPSHYTSHLLDSLPSSFSSSSSSRKTGRAAPPTTNTAEGNSVPNPEMHESPVHVTLDSLDLSGAVAAPTASSSTAASATGKDVPASLRLRSHTTISASSLLTASVSAGRPNYTPISSEDEKEGGSSRLVRRRTIDSDTVSLCDVKGERERERREGRGRRQQRGETSSPVGHQHTSSHSPVSDEGARISPAPSSLPSRLPSPSTPSPLAAAERVELPARAVEGDGTTRGQLGGRRREGSLRGRNREERLEQKTKEVRACKNPTWNQKLKFNISDAHCYLNVCIWEKLPEEKGNLLIGHVTIPLMDVAMECLHTTSSTHQQRYVLVAAHSARASTSRSVVQATAAGAHKEKSTKKSSSPFKLDLVFAGDILLKFKHSPKLEDPAHTSHTTAQETRNETTASTERHGFTASTEEHSSKHRFAPSEHNGIPKCDICQKSIWTLKSRVYMCERCGLKCHKKCADYCMTYVSCRRREEVDAASGTDQVPSTNEVVSIEENGWTNINSSSHRRLNQLETDDRKFSESFEELDPLPLVNDRLDEGSGYSTADDLSVELGEEVGEHGTMESSGQLGEEEGEDAFNEEGGDLERLFTPPPDLDVESSAGSNETKAQLKWSGHLPPGERQSAIDKRLADLKAEIDRIQEFINSLYDDQKNPQLTSIQQKALKAEIEKHEEKLAPLKLLMNEMMTELAHCLTQQE